MMEVLPLNPDSDCFEEEMWPRIAAALLLSSSSSSSSHSDSSSHSSFSLCLSEYAVHTVPESAPPLLAAAACLTSLDLSFNKLRRLPESMGKLSSLKQLLLGHNLLSSLPESLGKMQHLELLHVHCNRLTSVPAQLCALPRLKHCKTLMNSFVFSGPRMDDEEENQMPDLQDICLTVLLRQGGDRAHLVVPPAELLADRNPRVCAVCGLPFCGNGVAVLKRASLGDGTGDAGQCMARERLCSQSCARLAMVEAGEKLQASQLDRRRIEELIRVSHSVNNMNSMLAMVRNEPLPPKPKVVALMKCDHLTRQMLECLVEGRLLLKLHDNHKEEVECDMILTGPWILEERAPLARNNIPVLIVHADGSIANLDAPDERVYVVANNTDLLKFVEENMNKTMRFDSQGSGTLKGSVCCTL